jgi:hypothetical protein
VVSDATSKPPRTNRVGAASAWPAARIRRRASAFKGLGAKICNIRGDAYTSDAMMLRRWANLSAIPPAYHMLGIHASGAMPFRARIQLFQAFPAPFPAVFGGLAEARGKGTPALPAATTRHRSSGQEESAGGVRKCDGAQHSVRSFREFKSTTAPVLCTLFVLARSRAPGSNRQEEAFLLTLCPTCQIVDTLPTSIVEPSTWAMMLLGFTGLGYAGIARQGRAARRSLHSPLIDRALVLASATLAAVRAMRTGRESSGSAPRIA